MFDGFNKRTVSVLDSSSFKSLRGFVMFSAYSSLILL